MHTFTAIHFDVALNVAKNWAIQKQKWRVSYFVLSSETNKRTDISFSRVSAWDDLVTVKYSLSVPEMNVNKQLVLVHPVRVQMSNGKQLFVILSRSSPTRSPSMSRRFNFVPIKRMRTWRSRPNNLERCHALAIEKNISPIADFIIATRRALERDESIFWTLELATQGYACRDPPPLTTRRVIENHVIERESEFSRATPATPFRSAYINISCINR